MRLPVIISVPHGGLEIPPEVKDLCILTREDIIADSDEGAPEIYDLKDIVDTYIDTPIARAVIDLNRSIDQRGKDGVVKTHTIWNKPVYKSPPSEETINKLIEKYYHPYHSKLSEASKRPVKVGIDCHTMMEFAPPISKDHGTSRPDICISNLDGKSCPDRWIKGLADIMAEEFGREVSINNPFLGGYIIRHHSKEIPWIQIEISRKPFLSKDEKRKRLLIALERWIKWLG